MKLPFSVDRLILDGSRNIFDDFSDEELSDMLITPGMFQKMITATTEQEVIQAFKEYEVEKLLLK